MSFKYMNANPKQLNTEDCTARALSTVLSIPWNEAYILLSMSAMRLGLMMSSVEAVEEFLNENFTPVHIKEKTVGEFINNHKRGRYLLTMKNHITSLVDGINYDTFDPSSRLIWRCLEG